jgi:hypothetical protein
MRVLWRIETIERAGLSTQSSIAFSPTGRVAVAYYSSMNHALRVAIETGGPAWDVSTVDTVPGDCRPSLAFKLGQPAVSYRVGVGREGGALKYALHRGGAPAWSIETVAPSAGASSLAFSPSNDAAISYYDPTTKTLKMATSSTTSTWSISTVAHSDGAGEYNALSFIPVTVSDLRRGRPAIAYYDRADARIKYAQFAGTDWNVDWVQPPVGTGPRVGQCSLAHGPAGDATIVVRSAPGEVRVFDNDPAIGWRGSQFPHAGTGAVAYNPARLFQCGISYDLDGAVRFSLGFQRRGRFLVEAPRKTRSGALVGPFELSSVAFSAAGRPAISYYDVSNNTMKVAIGTVVPTLPDVLAELTDLLRRFAWRG